MLQFVFYMWLKEFRIILCILCYGCSSSGNTVQNPVAIPFRPKAIHLDFQADSLLNAYNGMPHAIMLVIYQLENNSAFLDLSKTEDGLRIMLLGKAFDTSVLSARQYFIEPSTRGSIQIDRVEKTQWIGIAAGYNSLYPDKSTAYYMIPMKIVKKGLPLVSKKIAEPGLLYINITLTPDSIQNNGVKNAK